MPNVIDIDRKYKYKNLDSNSVVIDIGGYKGEWAFHISDKYKCKVHVFEPFKINYYKIFIRRLFHNKIMLYNSAISDKSGKLDFFVTPNSDGHSIYDRSKSKMKKKVKKISVNSISLKEFVGNSNIDKIDLIKMNCEGAEIDILNSLDSDLASKIKQITFSGHAPKITRQEDQDAALAHIRNLGFFVEDYSNEQVSNRFYCYHK